MSALKTLQEKIGVTADGAFGKNTLRAAAAYLHLSDARAAHFFGQCWHESAGLTVFQENLNYSAKGLRNTWPKRFDEATAKEYARKPEMIANKVYADRMGNGNEASGDGWKYRGRGAIQLTGKDNYRELSEHLNMPMMLAMPNPVADDLAFASALFFFEKNGLWKICDAGVNADSILKLTRRINGGTHGLADRTEKTEKCWEWLTQTK